jgi:hypothetical protein
MSGDGDSKHAKFWQAAKQRGLDDLTVIFEDKFGQFASAHVSAEKPAIERLHSEEDREAQGN